MHIHTHMPVAIFSRMQYQGMASAMAVLTTQQLMAGLMSKSKLPLQAQHLTPSVAQHSTAKVLAEYLLQMSKQRISTHSPLVGV